MGSEKSNRLHVIDPPATGDRTSLGAPLNGDRAAVDTAVGGPAVASDRVAGARSAVAPKRARGRLRVEAILAASAAVFAERGYEAATMTEIAQRSDTAIGSLYRFFPNKTALAERLVDHYLSQLMAQFDAVARVMSIDPAPDAAVAGATDAAGTGTGTGVDATCLADALVRMMTTLLPERASVLALVDAQGAVAAPLRARLREAMLARLGALLQAATHVGPTRAMASAKIVLLLLKGVPTFADATAAERAEGIADLRALIAHQVLRT